MGRNIRKWKIEDAADLEAALINKNIHDNFCFNGINEGWKNRACLISERFKKVQFMKL